MMAKPMKTLELHYPMIQFLIMTVIHILTCVPREICLFYRHFEKKNTLIKMTPSFTIPQIVHFSIYARSKAGFNHKAKILNYHAYSTALHWRGVTALTHNSFSFWFISCYKRFRDRETRSNTFFILFTQLITVGQLGISNTFTEVLVV